MEERGTIFYIQKAFRWDNLAIKRRKCHYIASFTWGGIYHIAIFPEENTAIQSFFRRALYNNRYHYKNSIYQYNMSGLYIIKLQNLTSLFFLYTELCYSRRSMLVYPGQYNMATTTQTAKCLIINVTKYICQRMPPWISIELLSVQKCLHDIHLA